MQSHHDRFLLVAAVLGWLCCSSWYVEVVNAGDPYRFFDWKVTYGVISPLGVPQQGILINGQFPGPEIYSVTNDNIIINVHNQLTEPFLLSWNGIQQRGNSWQDGVYGTNCPIPPGGNYTYVMQFKDQIGSFFYFPSLGFHKAAGGFGAIRILSRPRIPVPFDEPAADYNVLIGDWYKTSHTIDKEGIGPMYLDTSVMAADFRSLVEIVFENREKIIQSFNLDGYSFFVVGMDGGRWTPNARKEYNLIDAIPRNTVQVYPRSWTAVYVGFDNVGMWNLRSQYWARQYLGLQFYIRVYSPLESWRDQKPIPDNALLCGRAARVS